MVNAPWNTDGIVVLREKWRMANERAIHCEKLKSDLELAEITLASTAKNRLDEQLEVINRIRDACILAYRGLFQTGLTDARWQRALTRPPRQQASPPHAASLDVSFVL